MSAITKQADSGFGSIELSLPRRESALCNTKSLALCAGQREGNGTQPDSDAIRFDVSDGSWLRENSEIDFANRNFVLTSINLKNKSAGDGCRDKTIEKTILRTFRARTFSRSLGQSLPYRAFRAMSGLLPAATELRTSRVALTWRISVGTRRHSLGTISSPTC